MSNQNWRKVLSTHIKSVPVPKEPGFIVYRDPKEVLDERTMVLQIIDHYDKMVEESTPDEEDIDEFELQLRLLFRVLH